MRKFAAIVAGFALLVGGVSATTQSAEAKPKISNQDFERIYRIGFKDGSCQRSEDFMTDGYGNGCVSYGPKNKTVSK